MIIITVKRGLNTIIYTHIYSDLITIAKEKKEQVVVSFC